ncbi:MAG: HAMP domain-containing histidine kinase [Nitrospirae bacterium]|nr:MAG: HAMP domain-containing histidine kinase [Nitrospirota bacterium]
MKKGIFRRIFLIYSVLLMLSLVLVEIYITSAVRESYIEDLKKDLAVRIRLISRDVLFNHKNNDAVCRALKEKAGARVTVIGAEGKVLCDSDGDSSLMENHLDRPEIKQAVALGHGAAVRHSDTLQYDFLYFASKTGPNFIRLSMPLKDINSTVNILRIKIIGVVSFALIITVVFVVWQTDHLRRLLKQVTDLSRSLARGDISKRLFLEDAKEFEEIAENLNEMSVSLQKLIAQHEEEEKRLNVILKSIPDALLIMDHKGTVRLSSSASKEFFGNREITGRPFIEVVRNREFSELVSKVRSENTSGVAEFKLDYPEERHLSVRVSPFSYKENVLAGYVAVFHDITMAVRLEQVRKDFVANVSHEIKTPVTAIKGFAETLLEGALDDKGNAVNFLRTIKSNSERINSLVDDLMTISKIELGVIRIEKMNARLDEVAENVLAMLQDKAAAKGLYLRVSINPELSEINADRNRLIQILTNLVDNSIKFTETGGVVFGAEIDNGNRFLFVEDTGIGIPAKHLPRLCERFYRVDPARSRKMGGTGLGLAIVKHLVRAHGWDMRIESVYGKGTKIKINI